MFVDVKVNGKSIRALVDTGATHNFIAGTEVERLGLSLEKETSHIKVVNSTAQPIYGNAMLVPLKVSTWEGRMDFTVVPMDDFQAILGLDFLRRTKTQSCLTPILCATNHVADALGRKAELAVCHQVCSLTFINNSLWDKIKANLDKDTMSVNLIDLVKKGKARQFWLQDGLLMSKGNSVLCPRLVT
ncbi:hypothetical protein Vadar_025838 [Vaccinium darrowii]|uniref:Uncharacterized protein n=1 Tax=Vaccinium darrowii TaxID=229202 RepID=A0ACB7Y282_9ERIC|nr:hypothetical protein Vadar_025838 [Vaccinium darrowii]